MKEGLRRKWSKRGRHGRMGSRKKSKGKGRRLKKRKEQRRQDKYST